AARVSVPEGHRGFVALAQLQGGLALVARAAAVHSLDASKAEAVVSRLIAAPLGEDGRYTGAVARWVREDLANGIAPAADMETAIINAISGPSSGERGSSARVSWEGGQYRLDLGAAERQRLRRVREKQETLPIDVGLTIAAAARQLVSDGTPLAEAQGVVRRLTAMADGVSRRHDFGFGVRDSDIRLRTAWSPPRQEVIPNVPWHVTGSLLGLDIALAPLALRRISVDGVLEAPRLTAPERESFALSVS